MATKKKQKVTITTIAKELGLSHVTVSNVLSGQAKKRNVADNTAKLVRKTANKMGYVPNRWARTLKNGKTGGVSLVFTGLRGDWAHCIMQGATEAFQPNGYTPIISLYDRSNVLSKGLGGMSSAQIDMILQRRDEGVICQPVDAAKQAYIEFLDSDIPVIFIGSVLDDMRGLEQVNSITWDCAPAAETAVSYLVATGHKKIAFCGVNSGVSSDQIRFQAYQKTILNAGLQIKEQWELWGPPYRFIKEEWINLLRPLFSSSNEKPDAIFAINDAVATGILGVLSSIGIRVPQDVALIGMGDLDMAKVDFISLTTVREPLEEIGKEAAILLLELTKAPSIGPVHKKIECNDLKIRKTA